MVSKHRFTISLKYFQLIVAFLFPWSLCILHLFICLLKSGIYANKVIEIVYLLKRFTSAIL